MRCTGHHGRLIKVICVHHTAEWREEIGMGARSGLVTSLVLDPFLTVSLQKHLWAAKLNQVLIHRFPMVEEGVFGGKL